MKIIYSKYNGDTITEYMDEVLDYRDTLCEELVLKKFSLGWIRTEIKKDWIGRRKLVPVKQVILFLKCKKGVTNVAKFFDAKGKRKVFPFPWGRAEDRCFK